VSRGSQSRVSTAVLAKRNASDQGLNFTRMATLNLKAIFEMKLHII
jgi:hypothetical protein